MLEYAVLIADFMNLNDRTELLLFCESIWGKVAVIEDRDYNCLKPPQQLSEIILALKHSSSFKSYDSAINFYRNELRKTPSLDALYMVLGSCLLEKLTLEKKAQSETPFVEFFKEKKSDEGTTLQAEGLNQISEEEKMRLSAESKKFDGDLYYKYGKFPLAVDAYLEAIKLWPSCPLYYSNCSNAYIMNENYSDALKMAQKATEIDGKFFTGHLKKTHCHMALGQTAKASKALNKAKELKPNSEEVESAIQKIESLESHLMLGKNASLKLNFSEAAHHYEAAAEIATANSLILFQYVESLILCGQFDKAKEKAGKLLLRNVDKDIANCMLGMCAFYEDEKDKSYHYFNESLAVNPSHSKSQFLFKKVQEIYSLEELGQQAFAKLKFYDAVSYYLKALKIEPRNKNICAKLYYNIALVKLHEKKAKEAFENLTSAIKLKKNYISAYLQRAELYKDHKKLKEAIRDYEQVYQIEPSETHKQLLEDAKLSFKYKDRKDYYKVLGLETSASVDAIKKAYKKLALKHHPDKHDDLAAKKENEKVFKVITEAYTVLKDPNLKEKYDQGLLNDKEMEYNYDVIRMQDFFIELIRKIFGGRQVSVNEDDSWDSFEE